MPTFILFNINKIEDKTIITTPYCLFLVYFIAFLCLFPLFKRQEQKNPAAYYKRQDFYKVINVI
ncbi:hypothetical protein A6E05_07035 [Aliivibrio sp. 1S165]|nr:hypothetical protein A6E05_07035 [Aliivibrio sp. 1S165]OCH24177.1 hypothetical protein A6E03_06905 [Aliivibrio sp. 1S128]OCH28419.1 hypothetical protein A6E06_08400 [Aliivibrio sp. 1S175]